MSRSTDIIPVIQGLSHEKLNQDLGVGSKPDTSDSISQNQPPRPLSSNQEQGSSPSASTQESNHSNNESKQISQTSPSTTTSHQSSEKLQTHSKDEDRSHDQIASDASKDYHHDSKSSHPNPSEADDPTHHQEHSSGSTLDHQSSSSSPNSTLEAFKTYKNKTLNSQEPLNSPWSSSSLTNNSTYHDPHPNESETPSSGTHHSTSFITTSSLQSGSGPSPASHGSRKPSAGSICGIVLGLLGAIVLIGLCGVYLKYFKHQHPSRRRLPRLRRRDGGGGGGGGRHYRTHSGTDSNRAVGDRSSFGTRFGAQQDPFAAVMNGGPRLMRMNSRKKKTWSDGEGLGRGGCRRPSYLAWLHQSETMGVEAKEQEQGSRRPRISAPMVQCPAPVLMHRSGSSHSTGVPISCMSAVVRRMSNQVEDQKGGGIQTGAVLHPPPPHPPRHASWTRDPYQRRGSILSVRNPDLEDDRITLDDEASEGLKDGGAEEVRDRDHRSPSSDLHYQDLDLSSTSFDLQEDIHQNQSKRWTTAFSPGSRLLPHHLKTYERFLQNPSPLDLISHESSSFVPDQTIVEDDELIYSTASRMIKDRHQFIKTSHHLSSSTTYSQESEERLELESPTDPAVRSVTPTSLVFVSFGGGGPDRGSGTSGGGDGRSV